MFKVSHVQIFDEYVLRRDSRTNVTFVSSLPHEPHPGYVSILTDMRAEAHADVTMVDVAAAVNPDVKIAEVAGAGGSRRETARAEPPAAAAVVAAGCDDGDAEDDDADALSCLWCGYRVAPGNRPVGCPVDWMPAQIVRTSFSEIGRDDFTMKENVTSAAVRGVRAKGADAEVDVGAASECDTRPAHYKTRWVFDNMNCMMAFAADRRDVPEYAYSVSLAHKLFAELFPDALHELQAAPHWSLLKRNGGFLTKKRFDQRIGVVVFIDHGAVELPVFKPYGRLISTKLTFTPESSAVRATLR